MAVWIKEGTLGTLKPKMRKAHGRLAALYASKGAELYVTRRREYAAGSLPGSLHYDGNAEDILDRAKIVTLKQIKKVLGSDYDVVEYEWGFHVEYDPA